jgi:hypothetical protein
MPLAWPSAVPTAALLKDPIIRCDPLCRIQFVDRLTRASTHYALTARATDCGWMRSLLLEPGSGATLLRLAWRAA